MACVVVHPEHGIFLGTALGLAFWSRLDPVGQPAAPTFASESEAREMLATWVEPPTDNLMFCDVIPDDGIYASVAACAAAGLEPWQDEITPVANERPC